MNKNIQKIIEELIEIDSDFREKKKELEELIAKIIKSKPDFEINAKFIIELKEELYKQCKNQNKRLFFNFFNLSFLQPFSFGIILTAIVLTPIFYTIWGKDQFNQKTQPRLFTPIQTDEEIFSKEIEHARTPFVKKINTSNGFGGLAKNSMIIEEDTFDSLNTTDEPTADFDDVEDFGTKGTTNSNEMFAPYNPTQYKYIYEGDLNLTEDEITIFKKQDSTSTIDTKALLQALNPELLDTSFLNNTTLQNISIKEEKPFGYTLNLYNENGIINLSIYKNWEQWPEKETNYAKKSLPNNEKLIALANTFTKKLKIDLTAYGKPFVSEQGSIYIFENSDEDYIPEEMTVIYPTLINGETVLNTQGEPTGINVTIDLREEKVSGLNGLTSQKYDSAQYKTVSKKDLENAIERGNYQNSNSSHTDNVKIIEIKLGEPEKVLSKITYWDSKKKQSSEILVPALAFPIAEIPANVKYFYTKKIILPLAADLYNQNNYADETTTATIYTETQK